MTCFSLLGTDFQTVCVLVTVTRSKSKCWISIAPRESMGLCLLVLPCQSLNLLPHISCFCFAPVWLGKDAQTVFPVSHSVPRADLSKDNRKQWWHSVRKVWRLGFAGDVMVSWQQPLLSTGIFYSSFIP